MTGQGGWPLTAFLTPSGQPFYGGTYFPPQPRHGLPSFTQILDAIQSAYTEKKEAVFQNASEIQQLLEQNVLEKSPQEIAETLSHTEGQNLIDHSLALIPYMVASAQPPNSLNQSYSNFSFRIIPTATAVKPSIWLSILSQKWQKGEFRTI
jgi:hypothetical protein